MSLDPCLCGWPCCGAMSCIGPCISGVFVFFFLSCFGAMCFILDDVFQRRGARQPFLWSHLPPCQGDHQHFREGLITRSSSSKPVPVVCVVVAIGLLLAPQSGALGISAYRDFQSQSKSQSHPIPLIAFQHLSLYTVF